MDLHTDHPDGAVGTGVRLAAALAVLVSGLVHLQLYLDGYRDFPDVNLGRSFLANAIAAVILAAALVIRREAIVRLAAAGLLVATLIAFWLSRTGDGIFGFTERGLQPSPQGIVALVAEIGGLVLIAATFIPAIGPGSQLDPARSSAAVAAVALVAIGGAALWARSPERPAADDAAAPTATRQATQPPTAETETIVIDAFTFSVPDLEIPAGTTVEWVNEESFEHSVIAGDDTFASETLSTGDTFSFTFDEPGTFDYACGIHPTMTASITVIGG